MKHTKILLLVATLFATTLVYAAETTVLDETFASGQGEFTIENVELGSSSRIWSANTSYGNMSASAYVSGTANAGEAWLISPSFDLTSCTSATLTFDHAAKFQNGTVSEEFQVYYAVSPSATFDASEWTNVTIPTYPTAGNWNYVSSGEISLPTNATKIAFRYKSTAAAADTWQVKNVKIVGQSDGSSVTLPIDLPDIGEPTLVVCGQNMRNYFTDLDASRSECNTASCFATKTHKIVQSFLYIDADIYALNELEPKDIVLKQLVDSLNKTAGENLYAYVADGIDAENTYIKSGFIYRADKVKPVGSNKAATSQTYYKYTMRYQLFEELATGGRFTLSINHFKAKDSTTDQGDAKRITNANDLIAAMNSVTSDPDILIMGDLNCLADETPIQNIVSAGYEEQLLRYDAASYSHCYGGSELIDHVLANTSMAAQITGAGVFHICTTCSSPSPAEYSYSDHDPYLVGLKLVGDAQENTDCKAIAYSETFYSSLGEFTSINVSGTNDWYVDYNNHYARMNGSGSDNNEDWLVSPSFDLKNNQQATLTFDHTANVGTADNKTTMQTLWMSNDYESGLPATATWTQVKIPNYPAGTNWTFVNSGEIAVPAEFMTENMHFAFKYVAATAAEGSVWEIKNVALTATCQTAAIDHAAATPATPIFTLDGYICGADNMRIYTLLGLDVTRQNGSLKGIYIVKANSNTYKVVVP